MSQTIEMELDFRPTRGMRRYVYARPLPENAGLSDHRLLQQLHMSKNSIGRWRAQYPGWDTWAEQQMAFVRQNVKELLKFVGMRRAMQGDYKFWRELAIEYGVIERPRIGRKAQVQVEPESSLNNLPRVIDGKVCPVCLEKERQLIMGQQSSRL